MYLYNVCILRILQSSRKRSLYSRVSVCVCGNTFDASCNTNLLCILFYFLLLSTTILLLLLRRRASRCFYYYSDDYFNSYHIYIIYYKIIMYAKYNTIRALQLLQEQCALAKLGIGLFEYRRRVCNVLYDFHRQQKTRH